MKKVIGLLSTIFSSGRKHAEVLDVAVGAMSVVDEAGLARVLRVDERDIRKAMKMGQLKLGRHYFLVGDKCRFHLCPDLIQALLKDSASIAAAIEPNSSPENCGVETAKKRKPRGAANAGY